MLQRGYAEGDLNLVYPLARGAGPMITFLVAVTVHGQHPGPFEVAGVLAVVSGVLLISLGGHATRPRAGVSWGLATGATIAAYTLWDNHSVNGLDVAPVPYFVLGLVLQLPFLAVLLARRRDPIPVREVWASARTAERLVVAFLLGGLAIVILGALNGVHRGRYQVGSFDELTVVGQTYLVSGSILLIVNQLSEPRLVPLSATLAAPRRSPARRWC